MSLKLGISREPEEIWCWIVNIPVATVSKNAMRMLELKIEEKILLIISRIETLQFSQYSQKIGQKRTK